MKKMMVALVGIVSAMMLASCKMEVTNDVSLEKTSYSYRMAVTGTASYVLAEYDSVKKAYKAKDGAEKVELVVNEGWLSWNDDENTNQKSYYINTWYRGDTEKARLNLSDFDIESIIEYKGEFYMRDIGEGYKVTVEGSPRDESFSVKITDCAVERYGQDVLLTFDLKFSR